VKRLDKCRVLGDEKYDLKILMTKTVEDLRGKSSHDVEVLKIYQGSTRH
jgi:hypothetical protein